MTWHLFMNRKVVAALMTVASGCTIDTERAPTDVARIAQEIQGGKPETGLVAVGEIRDQGGTACTGTLIASRFVLSAGHCIFEPTTTSHSFVLHDSAGQEHVFGVVASYAHPKWNGGDDYDQRVIELDRDVDLRGVPGLELIGYHRDSLPAMGTNCTAVGYGYYTDENKVEHKGEKRSCEESVSSADDMHIYVHWGTGIIDHLDSGGPLLCGAVIAGVVRKHFEPSDGGVQRDALYTTVDELWVQSIIDDPANRSPRDTSVRCEDYPTICVEHDGQPSVRSCDNRFGLQYEACGDKGCTEFEDDVLGPWAVCGDPPSS